MESKINFTAVGLFVVTFFSAMIAFAFWLGKYNDEEQNYHRYYLYITESVSGLTREAAVKFHGVDVGKVETIRINPRNSEEVELVLKINKSTPIKTDSTGVLKFYGITGLAFIEIMGGSKNAPLLQTDDDQYTTIPSSPSLFHRLDESLSNVASKLSTTLDHADRLFSDQNINNISQSLEHLKSLTEQIDHYQSDIKALLAKTSTLEENATRSLEAMRIAGVSVKSSSDQFNTFLKTKASNTLESLETTSKQSHTLIRKIEASLERGDYDLHAIAAPTAGELHELLSQTRSLTEEMESILRNFKESPSDLFFKTSIPKPGPGE